MTRIKQIRKRDGRIVKFEKSKIIEAILKSIEATGQQDGVLSDVLAEKVIEHLESQTPKNKIPSVEDIQDIVEHVLMSEGHAKIAKAYILYRRERAKIREAKALLGVQDDLKLTINAAKVLEKRYLRRDENGKIDETPSQMFRRVAENIAKADELYRASKEEVKKTADEFFEIMSNLEFLPNSPTLMNAGTPIQQLSACFVLPVEDSLERIFETLKHTAIIQQTGGGTGFSFSRIRPRGDIVKTTGGTASGPMSFLKVFNTVTEAVKQGGRRRGANMGILRVDHPDIVEFVISKEKDESLANFNLSVALTDKFMRAVEEDREYKLVDPRTGKVVNKLDAKRVWDLIVTMAWKSGDPGIIFIDRINNTESNPTPKLGLIESTNPCIAGSSLISTEFGLIKMEELAKRFNGGIKIVIDNRVHAMGNNLLLECIGTKLVESPNVWKTGVKDTYKITTKAGYELIATPEHKVLTRDDGWKAVSNLKLEDCVLIQSGAGMFNRDDKLSIDVPNIYTGDNGRLYKHNFPKKWSRELGQIVGWLIGDGYISLKPSTKDNRVALVFSKDDMEVFAYLKPILDDMYGSTTKEYLGLRNVTRVGYHSKYFAEFFNKLGVKHSGDKEKEVPESLFTATEAAVKGFLQGLFSADGTISTNNRNNTNYIRLTSRYEKLLKGAQLLLLNLGIKSKIYERHRGRRVVFRYKNVRGDLKLYESDGILYELQISRDMIPIFLEKVGFLCNKHHEKINHLKKIGFYKSEFYDKIVSVEYNGNGEVYDLTEPLTHSFIANGIVTHNCGESPLLPYESCNLGSLNLSKFITEKDGRKDVDWDKLKDRVWKAVRFLDNVIDMNKYPLPQIEEITKNGNRKIGLGVMGFADLLMQLWVPYNSDEAVKIADKVMKFIDDESKAASTELAKKRGSFKNFKKSIWPKKGFKALRNAVTTVVAPTGTVSIIAGCSSGIEPIFAVSYVRSILDQTELLEVNQLFERTSKEKGFYSEDLMRLVARQGSIQHIKEIPDDVKKIFVTTHDIGAEDHVKVQAAFQKHVDLGVSKTVNFPNNATVEDVEKVYMMAYKMGCKGITIYRDRSKNEQVLNIELVRAKIKPKMRKKKRPITATSITPKEKCETC
ncbi:MAG: ribonucleoside reductase class II [Candidatus Aenigmarchaeota archaeon]|nr:ribonucleoside reductase class II [Candidatus Aenigmarchaeota archaeon]